jgi:hypothetical protein
VSETPPTSCAGLILRALLGLEELDGFFQQPQRALAPVGEAGVAKGPRAPRRCCALPQASVHGLDFGRGGNVGLVQRQAPRETFGWGSTLRRFGHHLA